jgi:hypothetical protein
MIFSSRAASTRGLAEAGGATVEMAGAWMLNTALSVTVSERSAGVAPGL